MANLKGNIQSGKYSCHTFKGGVEDPCSNPRRTNQKLIFRQTCDRVLQQIPDL